MSSVIHLDSASQFPADLESRAVFNRHNEILFDGEIDEDIHGEELDTQMVELLASEISRVPDDLLTETNLIPFDIVPSSFESVHNSNLNVQMPSVSSPSSVKNEDIMLSPNCDFLSLLCDEDTTIDKILEKLENEATVRNRQILSVELDHDYTKNKARVSSFNLPECSITSSVDLPSHKATADSSSHEKKSNDTLRRIRNNEASRKSRALKKDKLKIIESDIQKVSAENQRMRVILKDLESTAKRCKQLLVSSISSK